MSIEVVPYDASWAVQFAEVRARLSAALAGVPVVAIEHVGSTSVPGAWAKPVLDIDVVVAAEHVPAAIAALSADGYEHRGDQGVPGREAFAAPGPPRRHVYVTVEGCLALRNHLAVRDMLRVDVRRRDEYSSVKRTLASVLNPDEMGRYVEGKSAVLAEILGSAGFDADDLETIMTVNTRT